MALKIRDLDTGAFLTEPLRLREFHSYALSLIAEEVYFLGHPLSLYKGEWLLDTPFAVGTAEIEWRTAYGIHTALLQIESDPLKIDDRHQWEMMLHDIACWDGALLGRTGVRLGGVLFGEGYNRLCVEAISILLEQFCEQVEQIPRWIPTILMDGKVNMQTVHPYALLDHCGDERVQRWFHLRSFEPMEVDLHAQKDTFHWSMLLQVVEWVQLVQNRIQEAIEFLHPDGTENTWRSFRESHLLGLYRRLTSVLNRPPLSNIPQSSLLNRQADGAMSPEISSMSQLVRQVLSPLFSLNSTEFPVSGRQSFGIYELWCFQHLISVCSEITGAAPDIEYKAIYHRGNTIQWMLKGHPLILRYNQRFVAYWERGDDAGTPYSLVGEQRPDFILEFRGHWLILDAKYRSTRHNVLDALQSAFSYVSTLKLPNMQDSPDGCYLLAPKKLGESAAWFESEFHMQNHFGLLCSAPNEQTELKILLLRWFLGLSRSQTAVK